DGVELGPDDGVGRAHFHAAGQRAVLADITHHAPSDGAAGGGPLMELDMAPVLLVELARVVVPVAESGRVPRELVPLLARHLAGFAADAERRVGEEADRSGHGGSPIRSPSGWGRACGTRAPARTGRAGGRPARPRREPPSRLGEGPP